MVSFTRGPFIDVVRKTHAYSSGAFLLDITVNRASTETSATQIGPMWALNYQRHAGSSYGADCVFVEIHSFEAHIHFSSMALRW